MNNQSAITQICKAIVFVILAIIWTCIFCFLLLIGLPVGAILLLILTAICLITYTRKSSKEKALNNKINELNERIEELEKGR